MNRVLIGWGPAALWAAVLFLLSAWEDPGGPVLRLPDEVLHGGLYAVLGAALWWARRCLHPEVSAGPFILLGLLYGISDEWHQSFVPGRDPAVGDVVSDGVGLLIGFAAATLLVSRFGTTGHNRFIEAE